MTPAYPRSINFDLTDRRQLQRYLTQLETALQISGKQLTDSKAECESLKKRVIELEKLTGASE